MDSTVLEGRFHFSRLVWSVINDCYNCMISILFVCAYRIVLSPIRMHQITIDTSDTHIHGWLRLPTTSAVKARFHCAAARCILLIFYVEQELQPQGA